jgi:hypothetical protein
MVLSIPADIPALPSAFGFQTSTYSDSSSKARVTFLGRIEANDGGGYIQIPLSNVCGSARVVKSVSAHQLAVIARGGIKELRATLKGWTERDRCQIYESQTSATTTAASPQTMSMPS